MKKNIEAVVTVILLVIGIISYFFIDWSQINIFSLIKHAIM